MTRLRFGKTVLVLFLSFAALAAAFLFLRPRVLEIKNPTAGGPTAEDDSVKLILVGDIMLDRGVEYQISQEKTDFTFPFLKIADELKRADLVFGNLESQISDQGKNVGSAYSFRAQPEAIKGLRFAGFDVLSLANNHALDYGRDALADSLNRLIDASISPVGAGSESQAYAPLIKTVRGNRIAFFAYTDQGPETWPAKGETLGLARVSSENLDRIKADIGLAKELADVVIVSLHAGNEYETEPNQNQTAFARSFIDAGADLVVGHHPHVVQNSEEYQGKQIFYSLGNFVFDQGFSPETMAGEMLRVSIKGKKIQEIFEEKIKINDSFQPELAE